MAHDKDYKKEWFEKSQLDYFSPFLTLWLACNSWYNFQYALKSDREHIDKLKADDSKQNKLYAEFNRIFQGGLCKEQTSLFSNLHLLHYSLSRAELKPSKLEKRLNFSSALIDFNTKNYCDLIIKNPKTAKGKLKNNVNGVDLGEIVILNDALTVFAGILEIIYQVRCMLVHGELQPTEENHEVVKYCYLILYDLMRGFCS